MVGSIYRYRWLVWELVARDLILRYRGTILGFLWTLLNPLLFVAAYTLVFSVFLKNGMPNFAVFLLCGMIPWQWFTSAITAGTLSILDGRMYVGKSVFRPAVLIFVPIFSNFVNYLLFLPLLIGVAAIMHVQVGLPLLALPLLILIQLILTAGLLFMTATFNVFFRDLQQLLGTLLMLMLFLSPIFYTIDQVPAAYRPYVLANPMAPVLMGYQSIFYYDAWPDMRLLAYALAASLAILWLGLMVFKRFEDALPDYL